MKIGTVVDITIPGYEDSNYLVIGEMHYSDDDIFLVARKDKIGCPINKSWLMAVGGFNSKEAMELRDRYEKEFPNQMKAV